MPEADSLQDELLNLAQRHVESARSWYGLTFDYSSSSLLLADVVISAFHPEGTSQPATIAAYGAYFGEVVRRQLGGEWTSADSEEPPHLEHVGGGEAVFPFDWARRRFQNLNADRVADRFAMLLATLGKSSEFDTSLRKNVQSATDESGQMAASKSGPLDDPENLLPASVLIVFLLIAAADGHVSTRELRALRKELNSPPGVANSLYLKTLQQVEQRRQELSQLLPIAGQGELLMRLAKLRDCLDDRYPQDADGFCDSLILLGRTVACAAAGWRGFFRSKVDRQAAGILTAIKYVLRRQSTAVT